MLFLFLIIEILFVTYKLFLLNSLKIYYRKHKLKFFLRIKEIKRDYKKILQKVKKCKKNVKKM
jgi:hypothetical protein